MSISQVLFFFSFSLPGAPAVRFLQSTARRRPACIKSSPSPRFADHQSGSSSVRGVHPHRNHRGFPSLLRHRRSPSSSASFASTFCSVVSAASVSNVRLLLLCELDASSLAYFNTAKRGVAPSLTSNLLSLLFPPHYATPTPNVPFFFSSSSLTPSSRHATNSSSPREPTTPSSSTICSWARYARFSVST